MTNLCRVIYIDKKPSALVLSKIVSWIHSDKNGCICKNRMYRERSGKTMPLVLRVIDAHKVK